MTVKPLSIWLLLLLLIGGGLVDPNSGVTALAVPASEEKELTMEEVMRRAKEKLMQAQWGAPSTLIVQNFKVEEVTLEDALRKLNNWGILTSLEKAPGEDPARFSLEIRDATVAQVMHAIVEAAGNYTWEPYQSRINPVTMVWIVNVFPRGAKHEESSLMNIRVPSLELKEVRPAEVIKRPYGFISELSRRYWALIPGPRGAAISDVTSDEMFLTLKLEDRSVRDVLNEISIRSGIGWIYEPSHKGKPPTWRVRW